MLKAAILIVRHLGRFDAEVTLLERLDKQRPAPHRLQQISIAHLRNNDLGSARETAERAIAQGTGPAPTHFVQHLADLAAAEEFAATVNQLSEKPPASLREGRGRIAYCLHNSLPNARGGYALRSHALATAIRAAGRDLVCVARPGFPSDGQDYEDKLVERTEIDGIPYRFENSFGRRGRSYGYIREAADYFQRVFIEQEIGIVHAATNFWTALPAGIAARRLGLPFIYEVRSFWSVTREAREPGFGRTPQARRDDLLERVTLGLADAVMALNDAMANYLGRFGIDPDAVAIIPNCVDADRFEPGEPDLALAARYGLRDEGIAVGYIGAMREYEGLNLLVESVAQLCDAHPGLTLTIAGADAAKLEEPGSVEHDLAEQIEEAGAGGRIRLLPTVPPEDVPDLYRLFDICAYPRRGFEVTELVPPLKPLEAMASAKPVVISDVAGMADLVEDGKTGLLCGKDDVGSLAGALDRLAADTALRKRLGEAAREFVAAERSWSRVAATIGEVYDGAWESRGSRPSLGETLAALFGTNA